MKEYERMLAMEQMEKELASEDGSISLILDANNLLNSYH